MELRETLGSSAVLTTREGQRWEGTGLHPSIPELALDPLYVTWVTRGSRHFEDEDNVTEVKWNRQARRTASTSTCRRETGGAGKWLHQYRVIGVSMGTGGLFLASM